MSKPVTPHAASNLGGTVIANNDIFLPAIVAGATVPTDASAGYGVGCIFIHTDGSSGDAVYVNEGSATSCDFNSLAVSAGAADLTLADDVDISFGTGADALARWSTGDASNHALVIATGDSSQALHITDKGAVATDWNISAPTHPTVYVHSNTTPATDYIAVGAHDGTTAHIDVVGGTTLAFDIASVQAAKVIAGGIQLGVAGTTLGLLKLDGNTSGTVTINTAAAAGTYTLTLPPDDGDAGEQLQTDGSGVLTFEAAGSMRAVKNVIEDLSGKAHEALDRIRTNGVYAFQYKPDARKTEGLPALSDTQTVFHGVMADEYPEVMMWGGKIFCPISAFGEAMLAIKALAAEVTDLKAKLAAE